MTSRDEIIAKIIQEPESLTSDEIAYVFSDPELTESYNVTVALMRGCVEIPEFDVEAGLQEMHKHMSAKTSQGKFWFKRRWAAIFVIGLSMAAIACIWSMSGESGDSSVAPTLSIETADTAPTVEISDEESSSMKYDAPLEVILADVARRYDCQVHYGNTEVCSVRLHVTIPETATIYDIADMLNVFDDVDISISGGAIYVK